MLEIKPHPSAQATLHYFKLSGSITSEAAEVLKSLHILPCFSDVELDFAKIEHIDTIGLTHLLNLFKYWKKCHITISVINTNYPISILFKVTGLTRFFKHSVECSSSFSDLTQFKQ
jgi:anti-anti-sigma regulatory factor